MNKEEAKNKIAELAERFHEQIESYKKTEYNETLTRRDFIDPFFKALGWDMDNESGYAEAYREVIHEDRVKVGAATKAPDYSFRLGGGKRLFFVEAKKPSVVVKDEILPAYQIRRYGWSAKLPISIITDFEEFAVYDCTKKPKPTDKASVARIKYLTYKEYVKEFDFIWDTFSKEKVLRGSFDQYVKTDTAKKGTATVDKEFLNSLDGWRKYLAQSISLNNKYLDEDELNFVVQQTLDRIIFLRIAEDRGVEVYGNLQTCLKGTFYDKLFGLFQEADQKYNSGLFDFKKDVYSQKLKVDNKVIRNIIEELYYPESPYEFSVISVEILGSAYEQFLGKVIRLTAAHHAKIEEKPEVRKAGGVYYTPQYVVDYIVGKTLGKLIAGKTPREIMGLRIVDPSCGSGSFLIGAYQYLLDYHKNYYSENGKPSKGKKESPLTPEGNLTTAEKKRILLANIFGVDIDVNAVEVTKLSLLLKCMEGETQASIANQMKLFNERVLPTLDDNIRSGNSLINIDFYDTQLDFGQERKIKPFSWQKAFPEIFKEGGFDLVLGNPPWGADLSDESLAYLKAKHASIIVRMIDSYMYFINHSIYLLKDNGSFGMIIPSTFLNQIDMQLLRRLIAEKFDLQVVVNLGEKVFGPKVLNTSTILIFSKSPTKESKILIADLRENKPEEKARLLNNVIPSNKKEWLDLVKRDQPSTYFTSNTAGILLLNKLKAKFSSFSHVIDGEIQRGISPDYAKAFVMSAKEAAEKKIEKKITKPVVLGKHIARYSAIKTEDVILYLTSKDKIDDYPNAKKHLAEFREFITCREVAEGKHPWYALHRPRNPEIFGPKKFIGLTTTKKLCLAYDEVGFYATDALYVFRTKPGLNEKAILAVLHSRIFQFLYNTIIQGGQRVIPQVKAVFLNDIPVPNLDAIEDEVETLVDHVTKLTEEMAGLSLQTRIDEVHSKVDYCEDRINELIGRAYELDKQDIELVNKEAKKDAKEAAV